MSPLTFGVYLIHTHPLVFNWLGRRFSFLARGPAWRLVLGTVVIAIGIFAACAAVDWVRLQLFRLLKVKSLLQKLELKIQKR